MCAYNESSIPHSITYREESCKVLCTYMSLSDHEGTQRGREALK